MQKLNLCKSRATCTQLTKAREDEEGKYGEPDHDGWDEAEQDDPEEWDDHGQQEATEQHPPARLYVHEHPLSHLWWREGQGGDAVHSIWIHYGLLTTCVLYYFLFRKTAL